MTIPTKTIKIDDATHRRLKVIAARSGEHVYEVVARLVKESQQHATNGARKGAGK